jgi:hypothetical protein
LLLAEQIQQSFDIRVKDSAGNSVGLKRAGKLCDACRRFRGFCCGWKDEEHEALCRMQKAMASSLLWCHSRESGNPFAFRS